MACRRAERQVRERSLRSQAFNPVPAQGRTLISKSDIENLTMHIVAGILANDINPLLLGMLVARIIFRASPLPIWRYALASTIGLGIAVGLAEAGKIHSVLPGSHSFPSGHETFGASVCASLCCADRRMLIFCVCALALLGWGLVNSHYHIWRDVAGGAVLGAVVTTGVLKLARLGNGNSN